MTKPMVDYRDFRFSKLNDPQFSHLKLLGGWLVYFLLYFLTENLIPVEKCHLMHCAVDDWIPFNEIFFIPYCFWFLLTAVTLVYFLLYDVENFKNFQIFKQFGFCRHHILLHTKIRIDNSEKVLSPPLAETAFRPTFFL